jgi:serine/threonine protein kinase
MAESNFMNGRFEFISKLSIRSQVSVYQVNDNNEKDEALKIKALKVYEPIKSMEAKREADLLQMCTSEFIVKFLGFQRENDCYLWTKFYRNGTLEDKIQKNTQIHHYDIQHYSIQILEALNFLHTKKIVHRDLKPAYVYKYDVFNSIIFN